MLQNKLFTIIKTKKLKNLLPAFKNSAKSMMHSSSDYILFSSFFQSPQGNYGDRIIPNLAIDLLDYILDEQQNYKLTQANSGQSSLVEFHENHPPKALIIGPGGIISGKSEKNKESPYKLFINFSAKDAENLHNKNIPIFFWGSGTNIWSNKRKFSQELKLEITAILKHVNFAFIRAKSDIEFLKSFTPKELHYKFKYQPCPSFFTQELRNIKKAPKKNCNRIAINIAEDQLFEFFQLPENKLKEWNKDNSKYLLKFSNLLTPAIKHLENKNLEPVFFCNTKQDSKFALKYFPSYERIETHLISSEFMKIEKLLSRFRFSIGMRLHAWIPFLSLEIPSIFLTPFSNRSSMPCDLELPKLSCFIIENKEFNLIDAIDNMIDEEENIINQIKLQKKKQLDITKANISLISNTLKTK